MKELFELYPVSMFCLALNVLVVLTAAIAGMAFLITVRRDNKRMGL